MQRVIVAAQAIQHGLFLCRFLLDHHVWRARRRFIGSRARAPVEGFVLASEPATAAEEDGALVVEERFAGCFVDGGDARLDDGGAALVDDFEEFGVRDERAGGGDGVGEDLEVLLTVKEHHGGEIRDEVGNLVGGFRGEEGDHTECWEGLEVLVSLTIHQVLVSSSDKRSHGEAYKT